MSKGILLGKTKEVLAYGDRIEKVFERMAMYRLDETAILDGNCCYSYEYINKKANGIARTLSQLGIIRNDVVAIRFERSMNMIATILGIMKIGATYVPIGLNIPDERVEYILNDCNAKMFLVQEHEMGIKTTKAMYMFRNLVFDECSENIDTHFSMYDIAYILYTSGSTGSPKGVRVRHNSVINHIQWRLNCCEGTEGDVFLLKTPYTFDISVWEMFMWFFIGAKLCILAEGEEKNIDHILSEINKHSVSVCQFVPSLLSELLKYTEHRKDEKKLSSLRVVFSGGEILAPTLVERFKSLLSDKYGTRLFNVYGPTETTIDSTFFCCNNDECEKWDRVPLGQPIWNTNIYIIDDDGNICEEGFEGEIVISGDGVAQGYAGAINGSAFEKIEGVQEDNIYRTGDMGVIVNGCLYFAGRQDNQIKIRGMRVELEEIESRLLSFGNIRKVVVGYDENHDNGRLYSYYVADEKIEDIEIKDFLSKYFPDYMIPDCYIQIDNLRYTTSGKIDRKQVSNMFFEENNVGGTESNSDYLLQPNEIEILEALKKSVDISGDIPKSATLSDFGINSLKFISLIVDLEETFDIVIDGEMLVPNQYPTIFDMVKYVASLVNERN